MSRYTCHLLTTLRFSHRKTCNLRTFIPLPLPQLILLSGAVFLISTTWFDGAGQGCTEGIVGSNVACLYMALAGGLFTNGPKDLD
jgi:hypothetical protein